MSKYAHLFFRKKMIFLLGDLMCPKITMVIKLDARLREDLMQAISRLSIMATLINLLLACLIPMNDIDNHFLNESKLLAINLSNTGIPVLDPIGCPTPALKSALSYYLSKEVNKE